ncbi:MAG: hypothetical protein U5L45_18515 [Saprospiraceae bacterium]|nr:hypothetical protein [Saprospiraceae bacterium]
MKSSNYCNHLAHSSLRSQKREMWFVFRALPEKTNHLFPRASEASA